MSQITPMPDAHRKPNEPRWLGPVMALVRFVLGVAVGLLIALKFTRKFSPLSDTMRVALWVVIPLGFGVFTMISTWIVSRSKVPARRED